MQMKCSGILVCSLVFLMVAPSVCFGGEIRLMFPKIEVKEKSSAEGKSYVVFSKKEQYGSSEYLEKSLSEFVKEFENREYRVDQIEIWIEGRAESGGVTRLFVSSEGGGGYKVILRPKGR